MISNRASRWLVKSAAIVVAVGSIIGINSSGMGGLQRTAYASTSCPPPDSAPVSTGVNTSGLNCGAFGDVLQHGSIWAPEWSKGGDLSVYSNGPTYGINGQNYGYSWQFQCTELALRFAQVALGVGGINPDNAWRSKGWDESAKGLWPVGPSMGLVQHPNGGADAPQRGDLLVMDDVNSAGVVVDPGRTGHVAVVTGVGGGYVNVVDENGGPDNGALKLPINGTTMPDAAFDFGDRVIGWLRGLPTSSGSPSTVAFQDNGTNLWVGSANTRLGMMPHTSPSVATWGAGLHETAFQANTGTLAVYGDAGNAVTGGAMNHATSPSIAAPVLGSWEVAYEGADNHLHMAGASTYDTGLAMRPGTSPSIAALPSGGFEVVYQAYTGTLAVYGNAGTAVTGGTMNSASSPSIAAPVSGSWEVAYEGADNHLHMAGASTYDTLLGMRSGTSPSIAALPSGGFEVAYQGNSGTLAVYGNAGSTVTTGAMNPGSSPSIAAPVLGSWEVAYEGADNHLHMAGASTYDTGLWMQPGTAPSIARI